jgi:hypothetical protein
VDRALEALAENGEVKASRLPLKHFKIGDGLGNLSYGDRELCVMQMAYVLAMSRKGKTVDAEPPDHPPCVANLITAFAINYNDSCTDEEREKLRPLIPKMLNTKGDGKGKWRDRYLRKVLSEYERSEREWGGTFLETTGTKPKNAKVGAIAEYLGDTLGGYDPDLGLKVLKTLIKGSA